MLYPQPAAGWTSTPTLAPSPAVRQLSQSGDQESPSIFGAGAPLPFGSDLYIPRVSVETLALETVQQAGSLIRIKAPKRFGKTSLINHLLGSAESLGIQPVFVDLGQADAAVLADLAPFLRWFCESIGQQLSLEPRFDHYWFDDAGAKLSCTTYMQEYILRQSPGPLLIALDNVQDLGEQPVAQPFLAMLRSWHERARVQDNWQNLRLIMAHAADFEPVLPANQSPFNIGLPLSLPELTPAQIKELAGRYELPKAGIGFDQLQPLIESVGGHPYLLHLAFAELRSGQVGQQGQHG